MKPGKDDGFAQAFMGLFGCYPDPNGTLAGKIPTKKRENSSSSGAKLLKLPKTNVFAPENGYTLED